MYMRIAVVVILRLQFSHIKMLFLLELDIWKRVLKQSMRTIKIEYPLMAFKKYFGVEDIKTYQFTLKEKKNG